MINAILILGIMVIAMVGMRRQAVGEALSLEQSNSIKGIAALLLVLVHIQNSLTHSTAYSILSAGGYLLVGIFFFYSGYGTVKKSILNPQYFEKRLPSRLLYLVKMVIITETIYLLVSTMIFGERFTVNQILLNLFGVHLLNGAMWYIVALIIIYFTVLLARRLHIGGGYTQLSIISCCIYILICVLRRRPPHEMQSCIAFVMGAYVAENSLKLEKSLQTRRIQLRLFILAASSFVMSNVVIYGVRHFWRDFDTIRVVFGSISTIAFVLMLYVFLMRISIGNWMLRKLGAISTEIYLSHQLIINIADHYLPEMFDAQNTIALSVIILSAVVVVSCAINWMERKLSNIKLA